MFVGHYAVGFALKKKTPDIPLWLFIYGLGLLERTRASCLIGWNLVNSICADNLMGRHKGVSW